MRTMCVCVCVCMCEELSVGEHSMHALEANVYVLLEGVVEGRRVVLRGHGKVLCGMQCWWSKQELVTGMCRA